MKTSSHLIRAAVGSFMTAATLLTNVAFTAAPAAAGDGTGAVFVLTNNAVNSVAIFNRAADGSLTAAGTVLTGGAGLAAGLGSQGALALGDDRRTLFAVNAGSNEVSAFVINRNTPRLVAKVSSNGIRPISLAVHDNVLYVLNQGNATSAGNISGFKVAANGALTAISGSTQSLSSNANGSMLAAAQVSFDRDGEHLVVTEKGSNKIDVYTVNNSVAQPPVVYASNGNVPFGFAITNANNVIVSEAASGAVSSYKLTEKGLASVTASASTHQGAPCWVAVTGNGKFAYTTNAASASISGFAVAQNGTLTPLNSTGITAVVGPNVSPVDMGLSVDSKFLFALTRDPVTNMRGISAFAVQADGSLVAIAGIAGQLPAFAASVASY